MHAYSVKKSGYSKHSDFFVFTQSALVEENRLFFELMSNIFLPNWTRKTCLQSMPLGGSEVETSLAHSFCHVNYIVIIIIYAVYSAVTVYIVFGCLKIIGSFYCMASNLKRKIERHQLTVSQKYEIVTRIDSNPKINRSNLADEYKVSKATISRIYKEQRDKILAQFSSGDYANSNKRIKTALYEDVDQELLNWFKQADAAHMEGISGEVLLEKAKQFTKMFHYPSGSEPGISWIARWKVRHEIVHKKQIGEGADVVPEMTNEWFQNSLPAILKQYHPGTSTILMSWDFFGSFRLMGRTHLKEKMCWWKKEQGKNNCSRR